MPRGIHRPAAHHQATRGYRKRRDSRRYSRRDRTVTMNRGMAEDVFRKEDLSDLLSAEAVDSVVAEVSGRAAGRKPRSRDELFELIRAHGSMTQSEVEERV